MAAASPRPKQSEYLTWSKRRIAAPYNLARSGTARLPLAEISPTLEDLLVTGEHEDGWPPLLDAIGGRYGVSSACVATTHACSMANHLAYAALLEAGDDVLLESPVYEPLVTLASFLGAHPVFVSRRQESGWRLDPSDVGRALTTRTKLVVLSNLNNPTGARDDDDTLLEIARAAERVGAHVLVDEVYLEFLYPDGARTAARLAPNLLATSSLTKVFGLDALRVGWVIAQPALAERIRRVNDLFSVTTAHPSERLAARTLELADELLATTNTLLRVNAGVVDEFVRAQPALSWTRPAGGTVGFVRVHGIDVDRLAARCLREHGVAVVPGRFFGAPDHFRVAFGIQTAALRTALDLIGGALASTA